MASLVSTKASGGVPLHQMCQFENSNKEVRRFFQRLKIPYKSDTVYVFIVPPMTAARLEGTINPLIDYLRKQGVNEDIVLLAVSDKRRAAERYLKRRNFNADYQLVVEGIFLTSFQFSPVGILEVPFITKFCISSGELLAARALMGTIDSATVALFVADTSKPRIKRRNVQSSPKSEVKGETFKPVFEKMTKLCDTEEYPLSTTHYLTVNPSGTCLALMDDMTCYIYIFDLVTGRLINVLYPDSTEERLFLNLPGEIRLMLKQMNLINAMYFNHQFSDDTTLWIAASLPEMVIEAIGEDTTVSYYNKPVIVRKSIFSNEPLNCFSLGKLPDNFRGGFDHTSASLIPDEGLIFTPFRKGWPYGSEMLNEEMTPPEENPFTDEFYQHDVYQFVVFDTTGSFMRFFGTLGKLFERLKLGYVVSDGFVKFENKCFLTTDRYSGKIYIYDSDFILQDSVTLFDIPSLVNLTIDSSKAPLHHLIETFNSNFKRRVVDFLFVGDSCYAIVAEAGQFVLYKKPRTGNGTRKFILPSQFKNKTVRYYLLRKIKSGVAAIALLDTPEETFYCELKLP